MKNTSTNSKYRCNTRKKRDTSLKENVQEKRSNTETVQATCSDTLEGREQGLPSKNSKIDIPLNFNSTLKVCIDKINTESILKSQITRTTNNIKMTSVKNVTQSVTHSSDDMSHVCVTQSQEQEENIDANLNLLYDVIPHSTPAEKEARRAKRRLQLEQWKLNELSLARSERYQNRLKRKQGSCDIPVSSNRKTTINWKEDLVEIFFFDCVPSI